MRPAVGNVWCGTEMGEQRTTVFSLRLIQYYQLHNCPLIAASISTTAGGKKGAGGGGMKTEKDKGRSDKREKKGKKG